MYTSLQQIYQERAAMDRSVFTTHLLRAMRVGGCVEIGVTENALAARYADEIETFCRNTRYLRVISTRTLAEERAALPIDTLEEAAADPFADPPQVSALVSSFILS
jgi:hypothetical protein